MPILVALITSLISGFLKFIFSFSISRFPAVGLSINDKIFNNEDYPDPEGPINE